VELTVRLPSRRRSIAIFAFLALLANSKTTAAQQRVVSNLPDAPTPKQQQTAPAEKKGGFSETVDILSQRSYFFPDLAHTRKPLSSGEKFLLAAGESVAPAALLVSGISAGISQARDSWPGYGQGWDAYGKRYGATVAIDASTNMFGTFLLASMLHEDPRYFVLKHGTFSQRVAHALKRVVITPTDSGGQTVNISGLLGPLGAQGLANTYLPDGERTTGQTFERYGIEMGIIAGGNVLKEFWPVIFKTLRIGKIAPGTNPNQ
jgi:hypothetical protein